MLAATDTIRAHRRFPAGASRYCVIHVARRPFTGVWSVIEALARQQHSTGLPVAVGIIRTASWQRRYARRLERLSQEGIAVLVGNSLDVPFSVAYPVHMACWRIWGSPFGRWVESFARGAGVGACVVHCHNAWLSGSYLPIRSPQITVGAVATYHGIQGAPQLRVQPLRRRLHRYLARRFVRHGGALASVDAANIAVAGELFGIDVDRFTVVPNGAAESPAKGCPRLHGARELTVGHVGTLNESKGWKLTAQAVELARRRGLLVRLVLAGGGPDRAESQRWCGQRQAYAEFLGEVSNAATAVMPRLDAFCLLSAGEGMPMAALEALAAGVPVLATPVGGLAEVVRHGRNGYLLPRAAEALADRLAELAESKDRLAQLHQGALRSFRDEYHIGITDRRYRKLYVKSLYGNEPRCQRGIFAVTR